LLCEPSFVCPEDLAATVTSARPAANDEKASREKEETAWQEDRTLRGQEWNGVARQRSKRISSFVVKKKASREKEETAWQEDRTLRGQEWNGVARQRSKRISSFVVKKRWHEGPSGHSIPGISRAQIPKSLLGTFTVPCFVLGDLPVTRAGSLRCSRWPFAIGLLLLARERGSPVRRVRAPVSAAKGGSGAPPGRPLSRAGPFPLVHGFVPLASM
ncbi:PREDICTED: uncharacterized protein LOC106628604, partial [Pseudopodoces humilis]|uniref:uncharacterized protein LOC106628604 n=1 Tax=Pseudopodoces humilis TaxID=181119 RepID=UPI0006B84897